MGAIDLHVVALVAAILAWVWAGTGFWPVGRRRR